MEMQAHTVVRTAAGAAWKTLVAGWALTMLTYLGYLAIGAGWLDGLIAWGLYGDVSRAELARVTFYFIGTLKLVCAGVLLGALFLTWWARGLARTAQ